MCFTLYFLCFTGFAAILTTQLSDIDLNDNPVVNRFGYLSISVLFSEPPFSVFASTLWTPAVLLHLSFEVFDYIRVRDHYLGGDSRYPITKGFIVYYTISTVIESVGVVIFAQVFATSPTEHLHIHSWPFFIFIWSLWLLAMKRALYLRTVGVVPRYGICSVIAMGIVSAFWISIEISNLFGARLWESHPWTATLNQISRYLWAFMVLFAPVFVYGFVGQELDIVFVTLNRSNPKEKLRNKTPEHIHVITQTI